MWNKLFKKKQSKQSNKSPQGDVTKPTPATTTKCFSFGAKKASKDNYYRFSENNHFLQYESEIYKTPGEVELTTSRAWDETSLLTELNKSLSENCYLIDVSNILNLTLLKKTPAKLD